ncbi:MAG: bifunctional folylpolyglutamate synthase/dihydrofolate synthase [Clostridium sp.]|nr:bifunctional folylpolyglutamate synthase/dihydrofolate synthase [Clostridium sp.]
MMNLNEALEFIQSICWLGTHPGLNRITDLLGRLGDPQKQLKFVHITGTNGKGSVAAMMTATLNAAGYKVGRFTSPHLRYYNERINVAGEDISDEDLCALAELIKPAAEAMEEKPSEFEIWTAMALCYFKQRGCDIVVLEVGLGGRLDSTNVIPAPEVAVITNLGLEHTEYLGDTIEKIAFEKAGIIKPGCDVVLYGQGEEATAVVRAKCEECGCKLTITDESQQELHESGLTGQTLSYRHRKNLRLRLIGTYQYRNAAVALDAVDVLKGRGFDISERAVTEGFAKVVWPGRFEVLRQEPLVIVDGAHNPNGVEELAKCLNTYLPGKKVTFMMGVMADKDYVSMLDEILPMAKNFVAVRPESERALASAELKREIETRLHIPAIDGGSVKEGVKAALAQAGKDDVIVIFGSLYQVGEVHEAFE